MKKAELKKLLDDFLHTLDDQDCIEYYHTARDAGVAVTNDLLDFAFPKPTAEGMQELYAVEHRAHTKDLWVESVRCGETELGYWEWVAKCVEDEQ